MAHLSEKAYELIEQYKEKFNEYPRGCYHGEETMKEYEKYLQQEIEKREKIDSIKEEFENEADELAKHEKCNNINRLDNGKTKYTELFEEYKQKIEEIKRS